MIEEAQAALSKSQIIAQNAYALVAQAGDADPAGVIYSSQRDASGERRISRSMAKGRASATANSATFPI